MDFCVFVNDLFVVAFVSVFLLVDRLESRTIQISVLHVNDMYFLMFSHQRRIRNNPVFPFDLERAPVSE